MYSTFITSVSWLICTGPPPVLWMTTICKQREITFDIMAFLGLQHLNYCIIILSASVDIRAGNSLVQSSRYAGVPANYNFCIEAFYTEEVNFTWRHGAMEKYLLITIVILKWCLHFILQKNWWTSLVSKAIWGWYSSDLLTNIVPQSMHVTVD